MQGAQTHEEMMEPEDPKVFLASLQEILRKGTGREQTQEDVKATILRLKEKHGGRVVPIEELWEILERELGDYTLTEELQAMREGR